MSLYHLGVQQALVDAGLTKQAAGWGWPLAAGGAALLGGGLGALAGEDKKRGAMIGALGGLGAVGGARYGTGKLTKLLSNLSKYKGAVSPEAHMERILKNPNGMKNPNVANWVLKHLGAGAALGLGGLGAGLGVGSRLVPHSESSSGGGEGGLLGLSPERASQLQGLLPIVQQMYQASQGGAPLPSLASYSMFPEQSYAGAPGAMGPGMPM
jgi:hypothetical protein